MTTRDHTYCADCQRSVNSTWDHDPNCPRHRINQAGLVDAPSDVLQARARDLVQAELWKVANTARRQVAEEIAAALEERRDSSNWSPDRKGGLTTAAAIAREIGCPDCAKETS